MTIAALILLALTILSMLLVVVSVRKDNSSTSSSDYFGIAVTFSIVAALLFVTTLIAGWLALAPEYRLHKATIEKRILVEQARAEADAAVEEARAEVERAKGTSEANLIVADSITEPYLRYLYINSLRDTDNQVIYLPTEAGLPILEAERLSQP